MKNSKWLAALLLGLLALPLPAYPHGGGHDHGKPVPPAVQELEEHLHELNERRIRTGTTATEDEEAQVGRQLLVRASEEWQRTVLEADMPIDFATRARIFVAEAPRWVRDRVTLARLGHWAIETAGKNGPTLAVTLGTTEILEDITMAYGATHAAYWFFVPLSLSHAWDALGISLGMGIPGAIRTVKLWERHGGLFTGPHQYYLHLVEQRKVLPFDWDRVIDVQSLPAAADADGGPETGEVAVAIIRESLPERLARAVTPEGLRILLFPRSEAQRASAPTLTLKDLEAVAGQSGVSLKGLARLRSRPAVYSRFVVRELLSSESGAHALRDLVARRTPPTFATELPVRESFTADLEDLLRSPDPEALKNLGETPDLVAQRVLWFSKIKDSEYLEELEHEGLGTQWSGYRLHRALDKALEGGNGLRWMADTSYSAPTDTDWQRLSDRLAQVRDLHDQMDSLLHGDEAAMSQAAAVASESSIPSLLARALEIFKPR